MSKEITTLDLLIQIGEDEGEARKAIAAIESALVSTGMSRDDAEAYVFNHFCVLLKNRGRENYKPTNLEIQKNDDSPAPRNRRERRRMERKSKRNGKKY